jgi:hypothetical protein
MHNIPVSPLSRKFFLDRRNEINYVLSVANYLENEVNASNLAWIYVPS